jgi:hypothetical protein
MAQKILNCRLCGQDTFELVIDLGNQSLTGVFPGATEADPTSEPLVLVKCSSCDLVQLRHNFEPGDMYGENYGYRSGLNASMVKHLEKKALQLKNAARLSSGEIVIDIGSNDGTFLSFFLNEDVRLIGVDPTISKFAQYYPEGIERIEDFFPSKKLDTQGKKAKLITSIAMFYDLPDPGFFARSIRENLDDDGIWHFEQSYLPLMLSTNSYDTICHEHLEYYSLSVIETILRQAGMKVIDAELNDVNGGSIAVTAAHVEDTRIESENVRNLRDAEIKLNLDQLTSYENFAQGTQKHKEELVSLLKSLKGQGKKVWGLGASTKGNVLLQYCNVTEDLITAIGDVNPDKFGKVTPGTRIPIVSEIQMREANPDYIVVLPWHFRNSIVERERAFLSAGGKLIFPLPKIEIVEGN